MGYYNPVSYNSEINVSQFNWKSSQSWSYYVAKYCTIFSMAQRLSADWNFWTTRSHRNSDLGSSLHKLEGRRNNLCTESFRIPSFLATGAIVARKKGIKLLMLNIWNYKTCDDKHVTTRFMIEAPKRCVYTGKWHTRTHIMWRLHRVAIGPKPVQQTWQLSAITSIIRRQRY